MTVNVTLPHADDGAGINLRRLLCTVRSGNCAFGAKRSHGQFAGTVELEHVRSSQGVKVFTSWRVQVTGCKHGEHLINVLRDLCEVLERCGDAARSGTLDPTCNLIKLRVPFDRDFDLDHVSASGIAHGMVPSHKMPGMTLRPCASVTAVCPASITLHRQGTVYVCSGAGLDGVARGVEMLASVLEAVPAEAARPLDSVRSVHAVTARSRIASGYDENSLKLAAC